MSKKNILQIRLTPNKDKYSEEVVVDGEIINNDYSINYSLLVKSAQEGGDFFILTCSCGDEGCAGLWEGDEFKVTHTDSTIKWHITKPEPERVFTFDKKQYITAIADLFNEANKVKSGGDFDEDNVFKKFNIGPFLYTKEMFIEDLETIQSLAK